MGLHSIVLAVRATFLFPATRPLLFSGFNNLGQCYSGCQGNISFVGARELLGVIYGFIYVLVLTRRLQLGRKQDLQPVKEEPFLKC